MYIIHPPTDCLRINSDPYHLLKYPTEKKHSAEYQNIRSVIYKDDKLVCFSPPKSMSYENFHTQFRIEDVILEEFVDGVMINVFYDDGWKLATKSVVGATCTFESKTTFAEMFADCLNAEQLTYDMLNTNYCYSFVMQHPKNVIILTIGQPKLWLVAVYEITEEGIYERDIPMLNPKQYTFNSYEEAFHHTQNNFCKGLMLKCNGIRAKIRNIRYENMTVLKGNAPFPYHYLSIRNTPAIHDHYACFPMDQVRGTEIEKSIQTCAIRLLNEYKNCFIHKHIVHSNSPMKFYLYELHRIYLNELRPRAMHKKRIMDYLNALQPSKLSYLLNMP
jgi:hypothetical protein